MVAGLVNFLANYEIDSKKSFEKLGKNLKEDFILLVLKLNQHLIHS